MMTIKVYIASITGNTEIKKKIQRVLMVLDGLSIEYEPIDICEPNRAEEKVFMKTNSTARKPNGVPLPPQIFSGDQYCGDYEDFDNAVEQNQLRPFLKLEEIVRNGHTPAHATDENVVENGDAAEGEDDIEAEIEQLEENEIEAAVDEAGTADEQTEGDEGTEKEEDTGEKEGDTEENEGDTEEKEGVEEREGEDTEDKQEEEDTENQDVEDESNVMENEEEKGKKIDEKQDDDEPESLEQLSDAEPEEEVDVEDVEIEDDDVEIEDEIDKEKDEQGPQSVSADTAVDETQTSSLQSSAKSDDDAFPDDQRES